MPGKHAYFSPSGASRWLECPASLYLSENIPDSGSSVYAHEGTICHEVAAECLIKNIDPKDFSGQIIKKVVLTNELIDGIQMYIDEIKGLTKEHEIKNGKIECSVELTENCYGTVDALLWNASTVVVCDLKMGKGVVVSAEDNPQLKLYTIGAIRMLKKSFDITPKKIINIIIQPRTPDPVRKHEFTCEELGKWYMSKVVPILRDYGRGKKGTGECIPGEIQCRWCPVSRTKGCVAEANKNIKSTQKAFSPFIKSAPEAPEASSGENGILTVEEMIKLKKHFKHLKTWMENIDHILLTKALAGISIPTFKLVESKSTRIWGFGEDKIADFLGKIHIEAYVKKLISPTQAEKVVGKKQAEKIGLNSFVTKPKGKPALVPEIDKRPEISCNDEQSIEKNFMTLETKTKTSSTLIVDTIEDEKEIQELSALQRMQFAEDEIEEKPETASEEEPETASEEELGAMSKIVSETATGGNPKVVLTVKGNDNPVPPNKSTKRYQVLQLGKEGNCALKMAAESIECTENSIKMHLKYLNERDGYSYTIFDDETFMIE